MAVYILNHDQIMISNLYKWQSHQTMHVLIRNTDLLSKMNKILTNLKPNRCTKTFISDFITYLLHYMLMSYYYIRLIC